MACGAPEHNRVLGKRHDRSAVVVESHRRCDAERLWNRDGRTGRRCDRHDAAQVTERSARRGEQERRSRQRDQHLDALHWFQTPVILDQLVARSGARP